MARAALALFLAMAVPAALAGCSGGKPGPEGGEGPPEAPGAGPGADGLPLPEWQVGDWWAYRVAGPGIDEPEPTTYVVTADEGADWRMDTDSPARAFQDARDDISRLGPQRKSDLAGSQGADRVEFFRWPLRDNATWATRWDGQDVSIRAALPGDGPARLEARTPDGAVLYRYTYDPAARWFGELRRFGPDGSEAIALTLAGSGRAWQGTVVRWTLAEVAADSGSGGTAQGGPFEVPEGTTDLWAEYRFSCTGSAGWSFALQPANPGLAAQQGRVDGDQCTQHEDAYTIDAPQPGEWLFAVSVGGQTADYGYTVLLRTRADLPFP